MKVKVSAFLAIPAIAVLLSGCKGGGSGVSSTTGWDYNDPKMADLK